MNPLLEKLQPYPVREAARLLAGLLLRESSRRINLSIGEPKHPTPELVKKALVQALDGLAVYPLTAGLARVAAGRSPDGSRALFDSEARSGDAGAAGERHARGAVRLRPDDPESARKREGRLPQSVLPDLRGRGDPRRSDARSTASPAVGPRLGRRPARLRLLAGEPQRRGDEPGGLEAAVRALRPPRLRDRLGRVLLGDLLRRGRLWLGA